MDTSVNKLSKALSQQRIINYLFIIVVFIVTRQFPFSFLSPLMNLAVVLMVLISLFLTILNKQTIYLIFFFLLLPLSVSFMYSIFLTDNSPVLIIKFYIVLLSLGLAYFVTVDKFVIRAFVQLCLLQVAVLLGIFLYLNIFFESQTYLPVRFYFLDQGWGDVYTYGNFYYRIQIRGSALLLIAFIFNQEMPLFKKKYTVAFFLLLGIVIAGNFAFLISLSIYGIYKIITIKHSKSANLYGLKIIGCLLLLILAAPYIYEYAISMLEMKQESSLGTRGDQLKHLMANLAENPFTLLMGQGLGNTLNVISSFRDYTGDTYFEIQILYIINQLGVIFFFLFMVYNILIVVIKWRDFEILFIYLIYISYAITNPYMFDTNHLLVIVLLNSWVMIKKNTNELKESNSNNCALQT